MEAQTNGDGARKDLVPTPSWLSLLPRPELVPLNRVYHSITILPTLLESQLTDLSCPFHLLTLLTEVPTPETVSKSKNS